MSTTTTPPAATTTPPPSWRGWFRLTKRHDWRLVAEGDDEFDVHHAMLDAARHGEFLLAEGHVDPNRERRP